MNKYQQQYYAWLDRNGIKIVPEFDYDFECREWSCVKGGEG
jgi:hypothetical protein